MLNIVCPICEKRHVQEAKRFSFCVGFIVGTHISEKIEVGCKRCIQQKQIENVFALLVFGWWSVLGLLSTPFFLLKTIFFNSRENTLAQVLREAGIDDNDVHLNERGFAFSDERWFSALTTVVTRAIWADDIIQQNEIEVAKLLFQNSFKNRISEEEIIEHIYAKTTYDISFNNLPTEQKIMLLRCAVALVVSDGILDSEEEAFLKKLNKELRLNPSLYEEILSSMGVFTSNDEKEKRTEKRYETLLEKAANILGVTIGISLREVKKKYHKLCLINHPDKAEKSDEQQAAAHEKMSEINWAYQQFVLYNEI